MENKHNFWYWVLFVLLVIWQLPQFIVAVVMLPFLGKLKLVADGHYNLCWMGENMSGGICLGPFCYVSTKMNNSIYRKENIAHEFNGHTVDSKKFGPLYLFIVGIPSILNAAFDFTKNYYDFYPEQWANEHAGLVYNKTYTNLLAFKDDESKQEMEKYLV